MSRSEAWAPGDGASGTPSGKPTGSLRGGGNFTPGRGWQRQTSAPPRAERGVDIPADVDNGKVWRWGRWVGGRRTQVVEHHSLRAGRPTHYGTLMQRLERWNSVQPGLNRRQPHPDPRNGMSANGPARALPRRARRPRKGDRRG